jgi:hypothetical protein
MEKVFVFATLGLSVVFCLAGILLLTGAPEWLKWIIGAPVGLYLVHLWPRLEIK